MDLQAQQVINNILLPDSLGSMPDGAFSCVYNETNNCIYVGGEDFVFVLDGATDQKIARIPVTGSVTTMLWVPGENKVFCAHYDDTRVTIIDGSSNSVVTTIPVGVYPNCLVYNATNNKVYCANKHSRDITVIEATTNSVITTLMVGDEPRDMAWNITTNMLYCVGGEYFTVYDGDTNLPLNYTSNSNSDLSATVSLAGNAHYVADRTNDRVYFGSRSSLSFSDYTSVGDAPTALCWTATSNKIYCANSGSDNISVISNMTVIATLPAGDEPAGLCWNSGDNKVYCLNSGSDDITIIDGVTDTVITTIQVKSMSFDYLSRPLKPHLAINNLNDKLYFPQESEREVRVHDDSSYDFLVDVRLGTSPWALAWNATSNKLYSINYNRNSFYQAGEGSISIIDGINQVPLTTLTVGSHPSGVVWNSTNNTVYCANRGSDNVSVIDGISNQIIDTIAVGGQPNAILWNANGNKIYTANSSGNSVSIIDGATQTLLINVLAGTSPFALTLNGTNNKIYCSNYGSSNVTVIDGFSNSVIATIPMQYRPRNILWNATNNKIYTASYNIVSIIDGVMDTVIANVQAGFSYDDLLNLCWNTTDNKMYCGEFEKIDIINGENNQIISTIWLDSYDDCIQDLFWNSLDNRLYCFVRYYGATACPGKLFVIDGVTDSIITRLSLPDGHYEKNYNTMPGFFAADVQHNRIFLANFWEGSISVIDPTVTGIVSEPLTEIPERFLLQQNYPNPFNSNTKIQILIPNRGSVTLKVYNILGEEVSVLVSESLAAGAYDLEFSASHLPSGVYLYRLETEGFVETKKMILMR
jgi:YVTN family beta-propeller protein